MEPVAKLPPPAPQPTARFVAKVKVLFPRAKRGRIVRSATSQHHSVDRELSTDCAFCRIVRHEESAEVLYENAHAIAILDINPIHYGHTLIIPKTHCETFVGLPEDTLPDFIRATRIVSEAIVNGLKPSGFNIFSNNGRAAGQSVFHFHFHITPRYDDDNIKFVLKLKKYQDNLMKEYADRIRHCLPQEE